MCWGGGGGDGTDRRGSEFNVDWKGVDCGVSTGSEAGADSAGVSVRAALVSIWDTVSIWMLLIEAGTSCGVVVGWDRGCEVGGVLILWCCAADAATGAEVRGQSGLLVVSVGAWVGGAEPEGRQRRLAAWASSAEETSCCGALMAWKKKKKKYRLQVRTHLPN